jgi:hypothetical protein
MGEGAQGPEARYHPDRMCVYAAGGWGESHAPYPGRSACLPETANSVERRCEGQPEVSRGRSSRRRTAAKGRTGRTEPVRGVRWAR